MRVVTISRYGPPATLRLEKRPEPEPKKEQVRIRVHAIGINFADVLARQGLYPEAPKPPFVPGYEVAGVVDAAGAAVTDLAIGDRVVAMTRFGGYSEQAVVHSDQAFRIPESLSFEEAAALPVNYATAYHCLYNTGSLEAGDRVLIHAAAGGVGSAAVQLALLAGVTLFGTASSEKKLALLRDWGVHHPINYRERDFVAEVKELTSGEGVDVILDPNGGPAIRREWRLLRPGGRLVLFGIASASGRGRLRALLTMLRTPFFHSLQPLSQSKSLCGVNLLQIAKRRDVIRRIFERVLLFASEGRVKPVIGATFPLARAAEAHAHLESRQSVGKLLLVTEATEGGQNALQS
jgi:NADPH:quinone reductase-like Zn-dependent oxidoreductase